ncbi:hypothetical protein FD755_010980 [Muntiacus reevesi]|uniref:Zinc finger CCCH domain-containing protein 14 n=1 Tax=Muntiacus reevesi TaxID=9886 RepID=A0A5N3XTM9_MUNRE|nr:hypothetical protein FD755_010980 [Muntiacus reevesi]
MEIGTASAIKGKLQELGAYVDEELPDYIMVMVANKKSQDQMTEDLSLFLGNNTSRFTLWLHGVLDKLRSITTDPSSLKSSDNNLFDGNVPSNKSSFSRGDERRHEAAVPPLAVSSTSPEKRESRVSTSSQEQKATNVRQTYDDGAALAPSEDVIDIKPEPDDLIDEDLNFMHRNADSGAHLNRLQFQQQQNSIHAVYETGRLCEPEVLHSLEETYSPFFRKHFRKRKLPVVGSVVKVKKFSHDGEEEEADDDYGSLQQASAAAPSLPTTKQANKNLILKAISEAQESKQTLPVAPRTRTSQEELLAERVQGQGRVPRISSPIKEEETKGDNIDKTEMSELSVAQKPEKLLERCKYWPACKNGDKCAYHHPVSPCKAFPNCKFAEKTPALPPKPVTAPVPPSSISCAATSQLVRKWSVPSVIRNTRFNTQCTRPDCMFYHPTITVPPQHALKWIRPQTSE